MKLRFNSLEGRIATLFLLLLIVVQAVGLVVIQRGIDNNARSEIATELLNGEKVFRKLMEQNAQKQRFSAQVLARDTGFVQAVGGADRPTIASALDNSARRAHANLTMLIDSERQVAVQTGIAQGAALAAQVLGMLDAAEQADGATGVSIVDGHAVQIVVIPVKAPITIAWVVMGFYIERQLAVDMQQLSGLEVAILTRAPNGAWQALEATLPAAAMDGVARQLAGLPAVPGRPVDLSIDASQYSARLLPIGAVAGHGASVMLARSIDDATAQYSGLKRTLIVLTVAGVVLGALGAVLTAKRIAQPLRELARTARRLERGDYRGDIQVRRDDEIGQLAKAFGSMRDGIAKREQEIGRLAYWDPLTSLPNRARFVLLLDEALADAKKREHAVFVLMMDLDRFKHVNDVMGHSFGDALLCQVAERLRQQLASTFASAQLARLGGDEFAVLLPAASVEQAHAIAARILHALEAPISKVRSYSDTRAYIAFRMRAAMALASSTLAAGSRTAY